MLNAPGWTATFPIVTMAAVVMRRDVPGAPERQVGQAEERVPPELERGRPGVGRRSRERAPEVSLAGDGLDDADGNSLVVEDGALLDVELEIGVEVGPADVGREDPLDRESRPLEDLREKGAELGPLAPQGLSVEEPEEGPAAEEIADEVPFLVRERGDLEGLRRAGASLPDAPQAFEGRQDAHRAVEHPAVEDRVDVRAGHDGLSGAVEPAEDIARPVLAAGQAGLGDPVLEPGPGFEVGPAERRPADPALGVAAEFRQSLDVRPEAAGVDADVHGVPTRSRGAPSSPGRPARCRRSRPGRRWRIRC